MTKDIHAMRPRFVRIFCGTGEDIDRVLNELQDKLDYTGEIIHSWQIVPRNGVKPYECPVVVEIRELP